MEQVLVTGGAGFIGSNFIRRFMQKKPDAKLVNLDKLTYAGRKESLQDLEGSPNYRFVKGDICSPKDVENAMQGCDSVINFAAESHVDRAIQDPDAFARTNFFGVKVLCEEARKQDVKKFVQISSVTGDTPLLVRKIKDKKVELLPIEELEKRKIAEFEVLTLDDYKAKFKRMKHFIKHPVKEVYKIYYRGGGLIRATSSHSLFVFENRKIVAKRSDELSEGDNLVTFLGNINKKEKKVQELLLKEILKGYTAKQIEKGLKTRKLILKALAKAPQKYCQLKKIGGSGTFLSIKFLTERKLIKKPLGNKRLFITKAGQTELKNNLENIKWQLIRNKLHIKKDKIKLSPQLMKIFGYYLAEGHAAHTKKELEQNSGQIIFTFSLKEEDNVKEIKDFFKKELGIGTYIVKRKESIQISVSSKVVHSIFTMFGSTAYTKRIPHWIWDQPKKLVDSLIKGYECDSAIKKDGSRYFTSVNKSLITTLIWLMRYNDINCSYLERLVKDNNPPHSTEIKDLQCYDILVSAENEFEANVSTGWRTPMARCLPPEMIGTEGAKTFGGIYLDKRKMISKQRLQKACEQDTTIFGNSVKLIYSDIGVAKIKKIEKEKGNFMVYDISVPGNEKFFGGNTPILLHNTDEVYGQTENGSFKETDVLCPRNPYSAAKAGGELLAMSYYTTYGLPVLVTRSSNNYGPFQFPEKVIPLFITNLMRGKKVPLYGEGKNVRDWLFVLDNCDAIGAVLEKGKAGEIYNIGGGNELQNIELTKMILGELEKGEEMIERVPDRLGHDMRYSLDCTKIQKELGWKPKTRFEEGLRETVQWYRENEKWWKAMVG